MSLNTSLKSFVDTISPYHEVSQEELQKGEKLLTLPRLEMPSKRTAKFDIKKALKTYLDGMPQGKSSWRPYTDWNYSTWSQQLDFKKMRKEEARFWVHAYTWPSRWTEYKDNITSHEELAKLDYTKEKSVKEWCAFLDEKDKELLALFAGQSTHDLGLFLQSPWFICELLAILLTPSEALDVMIHVVTSQRNLGYSSYTLNRLIMPARDEKELPELQDKARKLLAVLSTSQNYHASIVEHTVVTYNLVDEFTSTLDVALEAKKRMNNELYTMIQNLDEEGTETYLKKFKSTLYGAPHFIHEFALHDYKHIDLWMSFAVYNKGTSTWFSTLSKFHHPAVVTAMAHLAADSDYRSNAEDYIRKQGAHAVAGLIPLLAGRSKAKQVAIDILRQFKTEGLEELITTTRDALEDDTGKNQLQQLVLDWDYQQKPFLTKDNTPDWLAKISKKKPKLPDWLESTQFPPQFLKDHSAQLTEAQVYSLVKLLKDQGNSHTHSEEILAARKDLSTRELGELSWAIFDAWLKHGSNTKEKWAYLSIGHFGTALEGQKVAPYLKIWPKKNKWRMAQDVLYIYRMIGSDGALMTLHGVTQKVRQKSVRGEAERLLKEIAKARNLTETELEDRIIPDCDLDEKGRYTFDYGVRTFSLAFDSEFKPVLRDEARNKIIKNLPKPNSKDDADMAEDARETFKAMKKQLKDVVKIQTPRLESAMITGRTWPTEDFLTLLVNHPLMCHFARRLLWGVRTKNNAISTCFRVDEDNNLVDAEDEPFTLPDNAYVSIVHPLDLTDELKETWGTVFGDYEIIPPFPQLNRPTYPFEADEKGQSSIKRFKNLSIPGLSLKGFVQNSMLWRQGAAEDAGIVNVFWCAFEEANISCTVCMEMGFDAGGGNWSEDGGLTDVFFYKGRQVRYYWGSQRDKDVLALEKVPPMILSEVLYSLYKFTSKYEES